MTRTRNKKTADNGKVLSTQRKLEPWERELRKRVAWTLNWRESETQKTKKDVAGELVVTPEMLSLWVNQKQTPSSQYLQAMAGKWPVNGHWLLTGEGDRLARPGEADAVVTRIRGIVSAPNAEVSLKGGPTQLDEGTRTILGRIDDLAAIVQRVVTELEPNRRSVR